MSSIFLIMRRELSAYLRTWMGYIIAAVGLLVNGLLFNSFAISGEPKFSADVVFDFFYVTSGIVMVVSLFLSMRLMAEEKQSGTIVLFYTSPVSERQLIYGKFLSVLCLMMMILAMTLYMPGLIMMNGKISAGHLAAGYLNLILLAGSATAITLFASTLAPNQLIAAILGAFLLVLLLVVWMVADIVDPPLKGIFSYIALHNIHFSSFARGIFKLKDLVFYLSLILFFLECSVRTLEARRWRG